VPSTADHQQVRAGREIGQYLRGIAVNDYWPHPHGTARADGLADRLADHLGRGLGVVDVVGDVLT
jgi:hypothetical protein